MFPNRSLTAAAVVVLLALHATLALWAVSTKSVTYDEILHVTGGFFYNRHGDFRLHPENGVLPQRWAALPAALSSAQPPQLAHNAYWRTSDAGVVSHQFFYESGHDHWPLLMRGRALMLVFSLGTGWLVFGWARSLFGDLGGLAALALYALDPNVLAHAPLATSDSAATFFLLASVTAFWLALREPAAVRTILSGVIFGFACVAKFSAVLLPVMFVVLWGARLAGSDREGRRRLLGGLPVLVLVHGGAAALVIWGFYGFRYSAFSPAVPPAAHFIAPWEGVLPHIGLHGRLVELARTWRLLPEAFLYGYAWVAQSVQARSAFLAGDYSVTGWPAFFPLAFAWKTTLALLAAISLGLWVVARRWLADRTRIAADAAAAAPLLVLFAVYWAVSLTSKLNIGHRHLLPTYPTLFILAGGAVAALTPAFRGRILVGMTIVGLQLAACLRIAPHHLAFFNSMAGGPANGWRLLVDSSLDWGQDLPGLRRWLADHAAGDRVFLSYFGSGEPEYYGIRAARLPFINNFKSAPHHVTLSGGVYCISATILQQVYSPVRGPWTLDLEREYQELRAFEPAFAAAPALSPPPAANITPEQWQAGIRRFGQLRLARLSHVLRARGPDALIGYSILVFRLSDADVKAATGGTLAEWRQALEAAAAKR